MPPFNHSALRLVDASRPAVDSQSLPGASEWFSTELQVDEVLLAGREVVLLGEVGEEGLDVAIPRGDGRAGDEAVGVLASATTPHLPRLAADGGGLEHGADGLD